MRDLSQEELKLEFPCDFPIKVVGAAAGGEFEARVCAIAESHDPVFSPKALKRNQSRTGKYNSLTLGIRATSKEQIDAIYRDLKSCELVLWAL
ncbi:MAG: YbeD family protein [Thiolinea sp.]